MITRKCDRCLKFYDHYEKAIDKRTEGPTNGIFFVNTTIDRRDILERRFMDLCPHCMKQLIVFIFGDDEEETKHVD